MNLKNPVVLTTREHLGHNRYTVIESMIAIVESFEDKEGTWYSAENNAACARIVADLRILQKESPL